jgi:hypothetical protein
MAEKRFIVISSFDSRQLTRCHGFGFCRALSKIEVLEMRPRRTSQFSQDHLGIQLPDAELNEQTLVGTRPTLFLDGTITDKVTLRQIDCFRVH